ncbi:GNAT family N-acetyltransferase [Streptomyces sp. DSM 44917]|uniref:GNAT family N-acetyltransferase n=1 Tax=Streptomyces boetiae TaxID=3075541 RepID=A0ABU2L3A1_9ACTN|nr:GNAT family N-acetyltransferase [Streptomyces sp. DSM 44917]MDT0306000.1 GNAT family N-acetyltransferase [Streptomyces sp. DSM 44917]
MLRMRPTRADEVELVAGWESGPDTACWLGETGLAWHRRALRDPDVEHLIAEAEEGRPAGFVVLAGLVEGGGVVELRRLVLGAGFRGAGRGRALLRAAVGRAYRVHGAARVWLDVKPDNVRARALYASEGFVPDPAGPAEGLVIMHHGAGTA